MLIGRLKFTEWNLQATCASNYCGNFWEQRHVFTFILESKSYGTVLLSLIGKENRCMQSSGGMLRRIGCWMILFFLTSFLFQYTESWSSLLKRFKIKEWVPLTQMQRNLLGRFLKMQIDQYSHQSDKIIQGTGGKEFGETGDYTFERQMLFQH